MFKNFKHFKFQITKNLNARYKPLSYSDEETISNFGSMKRTSPLKSIIKLLERCDPDTRQYIYDFMGFFINDDSSKSEEDPHKTIEMLENKLVKMNDRILSLKKKLHVEMDINQGLVEENDELMEENEKLKKQILVCKICLDEPVTHCTLPCRHLVSCETCVDKVEDCVLCRTKITSCIRIYF
ncbi:3177_t:CDS:1 [Entrophospora sp. SA101]|nr:3177_t:CDS:1 [Entrophospora sp. SA101]